MHNVFRTKIALASLLCPPLSGPTHAHHLIAQDRQAVRASQLSPFKTPFDPLAVYGNSVTISRAAAVGLRERCLQNWRILASPGGLFLHPGHDLP